LPCRRFVIGKRQKIANGGLLRKFGEGFRVHNVVLNYQNAETSD
jgi:hypothetical protein